MRILREDLGMEQGDLVQHLANVGVEISQGTVSRIERDKWIPNGRIVAGLAVALGTTADYLLLLTDDPLPPEDANREPNTVRDGTGPYTAQGPGPLQDLLAIAHSLSPDRRRELLALALAMARNQQQEDTDRYKDTLAVHNLLDRIEEEFGPEALQMALSIVDTATPGDRDRLAQQRAARIPPPAVVSQPPQKSR